jgi:hypothetical protein
MYQTQLEFKQNLHNTGRDFVKNGFTGMLGTKMNRVKQKEFKKLGSV